ncbi:hypothetical protein JNJ66_00830 [Candidatus Saccharibacteria bacterium]|nr:hypothetical protein [Candidatus Saccharibacteria bacterium]
MPLFVEKKIKACVCGKTPKALLERNPKDQVFTIMLTIILVLVVIGALLSFETIVEDTVNSPRQQFALVILVGTVIYFLIQLQSSLRQGHSVYCAARKAYLKS